MKKAFLDHNYLSSTLKKANRMILVVKTIQRLNAQGKHWLAGSKIK
jgi:hypothetical protein